jgi:hypothetical protein
MSLFNDLRKFHAGAKRLAIGWLCFGALVGPQVAAQVKVSDTSPGVKSVYFPSSTIGGSAVVFDVPAKIVPSSDGGLVKGTALVILKNPSGQPLPVTASGRASSSSVSAALSKFIGRVATPIAVGSALYDLGRELGYTLSNPSGQLVVQKEVSSTDPNFCTVSPCFTWAVRTNTGTYLNGSTRDAAVANWIAFHDNLYGPNKYVIRDITDKSYVFGPNPGWAWQYVTYDFVRTPRSPDTPPPQPATLAELEDTIAAQSGWPTSSNVSRVLVEAEKLGIVPDYGAAALSGPSSTPGSSSTSVNSDGSSTTSTTTHNHTYAGSNITTTNVTVTTVTNTNGSTSTTTTTETPAPEKEPPPDQCKTNPGSVGCQETDVPTDEVPKSQKTITWAQENLGFGTGSCPAPYTFRTSNGSYSLNLSEYCDVLSTVVRPVVLAFALLAAFFIVAPVRTEA